MPTRLQQSYSTAIKPTLMKEFGYKNGLQVPRLDKIVINMGVGETVNDIKKMDVALAELTAISGQKPLVIKSKKAIANFKLRRGLPIGCKVTLRGTRMYEFLDRLITIALPRVRDFRGVSGKSFDGRGNYALGIKEQSSGLFSATQRFNVRAYYVDPRSELAGKKVHEIEKRIPNDSVFVYRIERADKISEAYSDSIVRAGDTLIL